MLEEIGTLASRNKRVRVLTAKPGSHACVLAGTCLSRLRFGGNLVVVLAF